MEQQAAAAHLKQAAEVKQEADTSPDAHIKQEPAVKQEPGAGLAWQREQAMLGVKQEPDVAVKAEAVQEPDAALAGLGSYGSDSDES